MSVIEGHIANGNRNENRNVQGATALTQNTMTTRQVNKLTMSLATQLLVDDREVAECGLATSAPKYKLLLIGDSTATKGRTQKLEGGLKFNSAELKYNVDTIVRHATCLPIGDTKLITGLKLEATTNANESARTSSAGDVE